MSINETILLLGKSADDAFDHENVEDLLRISEDCVCRISSGEFSELEQGILAYNAATAYGNYIKLVHHGMMKYSSDSNNEADFEQVIYLFRKCINLLQSFRLNSIKWEESSELEKQYYFTYLNMAAANYANDLYLCGRILKSIEQLKFGLINKFPMAVGNMACKLIEYSKYDYDPGHSAILCNEAYQLLLEALEGDLHEGARDFFTSQKIMLEKIYTTDFLEDPYEFESISLGDTLEEDRYRQWSLSNTLFLNTLNDVFQYPLVANDCIHLPSITTPTNVGVKYHGLFNQIKQEYASARFMVYEGAHSQGYHFSDKHVFMYNTLDYPIYGLGIEKIKSAYRSLYSLFDRISFFINDYFGIGIRPRDVSYKIIWEGKKTGKSGYDFSVNLKERMTDADTYNQPLIGLYWLFKDISKKCVKYDFLDPSIKELSEIRNAIEHQYLKIHDSLFVQDPDSTLRDTLSKSVYYTDFQNASIHLLNYSREAIMLLVLAIRREEVIRSNDRSTDQLIGKMQLDVYDDEWKQLF